MREAGRAITDDRTVTGGPSLPMRDRRSVPVPPSLVAAVGSATHAGRVRPKNEDYVLSEVPDDLAVCGSRGSLFLVADGVGGAGGGSIASAEAAHTVLQEYYLDRRGDPGRHLRRAIERANLHVYNMRMGHPDLSGMQTTLTALVLMPRQGLRASLAHARSGYAVGPGTSQSAREPGRARYWVGHVGDSRLLLLRGGVLRQLTRDHTFVEEMRRLGLVDPRRAGMHSHSHLLTRAIGGDPLVAVDLRAGRPYPGDCFILATDGLFEHLTAEDVRAAFTNCPPAEAAAACVEEANRRGGFDNLTVLGVKVVG